MPASRPLDIERLQYWTGQSLRSGDARLEASAAENLRWWHTRALHQAFGIASGLEVEIAGSAVTVHPGLAYDGFGREILLLEPAHVAMPDDDGQEEATLTIASHPGESEPGCTCDPCNPQRASTLAWEDRRRLDLCRSVPLARWLKGPPAAIEPARRYARPSSRPRIAAASTVPGGTRWTTWMADGRFIGFQAAVDTASAGFTRTPCYFAALDVSAAAPVRHARTAEEFASAGWLFLLAFAHVADATARGFNIRTVVPPRVAGNIGVSSPLLAVMRHLVTVRWLAVEPAEQAHASAQVR
jgi:hypothetical protein